MISKEVSESIRKRIEDGKREYSREEQILSLLFRNKTFLKENNNYMNQVQIIIKEINNFRNQIQDIEINLNRGDVSSIKRAETMISDGRLRQYLKMMISMLNIQGETNLTIPQLLTAIHVGIGQKDEEFFSRWSLKSLAMLSEQKPANLPLAVFDSSPRIIAPLSVLLMAEGRANPENVRSSELDRNGLYLKIEPWTQLEDIGNIWPRIEKLQKVAFGYRMRVKPNFGRDLCWYDLNKAWKQSSGRIAMLWKKYCSQNVSSNTVKKAIQRVQGYIDRLTGYNKKPL